MERETHASTKILYITSFAPLTTLTFIWNLPFAVTLYWSSYNQAHQCQDLKKQSKTKPTKQTKPPHTVKVHLWTVHVKFRFLRILLSFHFTQTKWVEVFWSVVQKRNEAERKAEI